MRLSNTQILDTIAFLDLHKISYQIDRELATLTSFKIGGQSPIFIEPENENQILEILNFIESIDIPYKLIGGGSNILISDYPDEFVTIRLGNFYKQLQQLDDSTFTIGSAANTTPIFRKISQMGYRGGEFLSTIPGWIGGSVIQNAGCYGGEIFNIISEVKILRNKRIEILKPDQISYGYRYTEFLNKKDSIILSIQIKLQKGDLKEIEEKLEENRNKRNNSQPKNKKSAGSVFKNPILKNEKGEDIKAWQIIDSCGLRGLEKGKAQISSEHCNFIVNNGGAKAKDVYYLMQKIQETAYDKFNILLEREVELFGSMDR